MLYSQGIVPVNLDDVFHCGCRKYQSVMQQQQKSGIYWQNRMLLLTMSQQYRILPFPSFLLVIRFLSRWIVATTNIWIEMTSILREHFICLASVLHVLRDGDMSETGTLVPKGAKNDIAYSQRCVQRTYVPTTLDVSTNFSHTGWTGCFLFVSSTIECCDTDKPCFHCQSRHGVMRSLGNLDPVCKQWFLGLLEGHLTF